MTRIDQATSMIDHAIRTLSRHKGFPGQFPIREVVATLIGAAYFLQQNEDEEKVAELLATSGRLVISEPGKALDTLKAAKKALNPFA